MRFIYVVCSEIGPLSYVRMLSMHKRIENLGRYSISTGQLERDQREKRIAATIDTVDPRRLTRLSGISYTNCWLLYIQMGGRRLPRCYDIIFHINRTQTNQIMKILNEKNMYPYIYILIYIDIYNIPVNSSFNIIYQIQIIECCTFSYARLVSIFIVTVTYYEETER